MKKTTVMVFAIFMAFLFLAPHPATAQTTFLTPFYIHLNPDYPRPYSSVTISLSSNSITIINSTFSVSVNGKIIGTGTGRQAVSFETGAPGKSMVIVVKVTFDGTVYTRTLTIHPASVALVVEPLTTSPVLYPGISTIAAFGKVRLVAIPNMQVAGKQVAPSKLAYTWKIGNETLPTSGVGISSTIIDAPLPYRENTVSVEVRNSQSTQMAQKTITLLSKTPTVYIYKNNPLTGTQYNHALFSGTPIGSTESTFTAVPYGFSLTGGAPSITWFLNGIKAQEGALLTVRPKGAGTGVATVNATVQKASTYESVSRQISVKFGSNKGGFGLFGL